MGEQAKAAAKTINDVAKALGLSKTTVSRAISGKGRVSEATRKKVRNFIDENRFRPNLIAQGLAQSRTYNIGVVLPADPYSIEMPFFQKCLMGASETAAAQNYDIVVITADPHHKAQLERVLDNRKVDAVILTRIWRDDPLIRLLKESGIPFLVIGSLQDVEVPQIDHDHRKAAYELTTLLLEKGLRSFLFLGEEKESTANYNRYLGHADALTAQGIDAAAQQSCITTDMDTMKKSIFDALHRKVDCILCMDDFICQQTLSVLDSARVSTPDDISIASLYNSVYLSQHTPPVSAIDFQIMELGAKACGIVLKMLQGKGAPHKTLLKYQITLKASTRQ